MTDDKPAGVVTVQVDDANTADIQRLREALPRLYRRRVEDPVCPRCWRPMHDPIPLVVEGYGMHAWCWYRMSDEQQHRFAGALRELREFEERERAEGSGT